MSPYRFFISRPWTLADPSRAAYISICDDHSRITDSRRQISVLIHFSASVILEPQFAALHASHRPGPHPISWLHALAWAMISQINEPFPFV